MSLTGGWSMMNLKGGGVRNLRGWWSNDEFNR